MSSIFQSLFSNTAHKGFAQFSFANTPSNIENSCIHCKKCYKISAYSVSEPQNDPEHKFFLCKNVKYIYVYDQYLFIVQMEHSTVQNVSLKMIKLGLLEKGKFLENRYLGLFWIQANPVAGVSEVPFFSIISNHTMGKFLCNFRLQTLLQTLKTAVYMVKNVTKYQHILCLNHKTIQNTRFFNVKM